MKKIRLIILITLLFVLTTNKLFAQTTKDNFLSAKQQIENMLNGNDSLSYEKAIYEIENAYNGNTITYSDFQQSISFYTDLIEQLIEEQKVQPAYKPENFYQKVRQLSTQYQTDFKNAKTNFGIFTFMTDTTFYRYDSSLILYNLPFSYSTSDPMGTTDWKNTQITHLLETGKGNCFALSSLYKIFADRLQSEASLCTAPNHIYIRHLDEKGTRYNIDVASRTFPVAGTLQTLTYSTKEAIQNNIALRKLNDQQSVSLCLVYLAKGYEMAFKTKDDFMMQCAETALKYDSLNLNAMLLKAELLENNVLQKKKTVAQLQTDATFKQYEKLIAKLYTLGYREMPIDMKNLLVNDWTKDTTQLYLINHLLKQEEETRKWTLSNGMFDEEHKYKPTEQYSQTLFNCKTKKITGFTREKPLYNDYNFDPVMFAMNVDPLAYKFPGQSPYIFAGDKPIAFVDEDGLQESLSIRLRQYETGYLTGKNSKQDLITAQRSAGFGGATGALVAFLGWGLWEFTPTILVSGTTTATAVTTKLSQTALAGVLYVSANPKIVEEGAAFVGGLFLPGGSQDLCPTCEGDEVGAVLNKTAQSAFKIIKGWGTRGKFLEGLASAVKYNLASGFKNLNEVIKDFKAFDFWNKNTGTAVSYKSFDQGIEKFESTMSGYIKDLAGITENFTYTKGNKSYTLNGIKNKILEVIVPDSFMNSKGSKEAIQNVIQNGTDAGVTVKVTNKIN